MAELAPELEGPSTSKRARLRSSVSRKRKNSPQQDDSYRFKCSPNFDKLTPHKSVTPSQRVREFLDQPLGCVRGKLVCKACREELSLRKYVIRVHFEWKKHISARQKLKERETELREFEFVDQVPDDYLCKLCNRVARDCTAPSCCGEFFCKVCVAVIVQDKKPCPSCGNLNITLYPQVKYQRKILALEVRCTMKDQGCEWTGQLQYLDAHLDVTSGDCQYVDEECPNMCDQKVQKRNVDTHLANECPNRDYRCPHCNFKDKFHLVSDHFELCPYYPLACPNRCGAKIKRDDLPDHVKMCRLEQKLQDQQEVFERKLEQRDKQITQIEQKLQDQQEVFEKKLEQTDKHFTQIVQMLQDQQEVFEKKLKFEAT